MRRFSTFVISCGLLVSFAAVATLAQQPPPVAAAAPAPQASSPAVAQAPSPTVKPAASGAPETPAARPFSMPFKVDVLIQRSKGATVLSSLPNSLGVGASVGNRARASLRIGSQVPYPSEVPGPSNYQNVGTNIDCVLIPWADGRFELLLTINDSSVANQDGAARLPPILRNYQIDTTLILREGQVSQVNLATDKATGETVTAQVTVTALKP